MRCLGTTHADHFRGDVPVTREMTRAEVEGDPVLPGLESGDQLAALRIEIVDLAREVPARVLRGGATEAETVQLTFGERGETVTAPVIEINRPRQDVTLRGPGEILLSGDDVIAPLTVATPIEPKAESRPASCVAGSDVAPAGAGVQ